MIELVVTISIVAFLSASVFGLYFSIVRAIGHYRERATVSSLADNYMEIARNMAYDKIGTINGNPSGELPDFANALTITVDKYNYQIYYVVNTISNDPIGDPSAPNYKQVKLYVKELSDNMINTFVTTIASSSLTKEFVGALQIKVYKANGEPLSGINIHIVNNTAIPNINLCRLTDSSGGWDETGLLCASSINTKCELTGLSDYRITVNDSYCPNYDSTYSVDRTYSSSPTTPTPADATVYYNQATFINFQVDKKSSLTYNILDGETETCEIAGSGIGLEIFGAKKTRVLPNVYKFDNNYTSNSQGKILLSNVEWDSYTPAILGTTYTIYGAKSLTDNKSAMPFSLLPSTTQEANLIIGPYSQNSLLITVVDAGSKEVINGASVSLNGTEQSTGSYLNCETPGQTIFTELSDSTSYSLTVNNGSGYDQRTIAGLNISGYNTLTVELAQIGTTIQHIIKASVGTSGGTISPSGDVAVNDGTNKTFTFTPKTDFSIKDVLVDGASQGALTTYIFTNVTADHTISAVFSSVSPDPCSPVGSTNKCPDPATGLGTKTCQTDGTWGACVLPPPPAPPQFCKISPAGGNWNSANSWVNCNNTFPQNGDSVVADSSSGNLVINTTTAFLRSFDLDGYTRTLSGSSLIYVRPANGTTANVRFAGTVNWYGDLYIDTNASGDIGTVVNLYTAVVWTNHLYVGASVSGQIAINQQTDIGSTYVGIWSGTWTTNNHNFTTRTFLIPGSVSRTFNAGSSTINLTAANEGWGYYTNGTNFNFNAGTSTINMTGAGQYLFNGFGQTYYNINRTGTAITTDGISFYGDMTIAPGGTLTLAGNSTTNRLFVVGGPYGTQRKITISGTANTNYSNVDFRDMDLYSSSGQIDLSGIAGKSGDCGGNNLAHAIFTPSTDQHWVNNPAAVANWSDSRNWTSRVPLCQDNTIMDYSFAANKTVTGDMPRTGSIDWSGTTWNGSSFTWAFSAVPTIYGSLTLKNGMTLSSGSAFTFAGRRGVNNLITDNVTLTGGISFDMLTGSAAIQNNLIAGTGKIIYLYSGTFTAPDNTTISTGATGGISITGGTFNAGNNSTITTGTLTLNAGALNAGNNSNVTIGSLSSWSGSARTLVMGSGTTWHLVNNSTSGAVNMWNMYPYSLTLNSAGSTIDVANNGSVNIIDSLGLGGYIYNNLTIHGDAGIRSISIDGNSTFTGTVTIGETSAKTVYITGSNTIGTLAIAGPKNIFFTPLTTQTIATFSANGTAGNLVTMKTTSSGLQGDDCSSQFFTFAKTGGGTITSDYISLQDSHATPTNTWHAGSHSINVLGGQYGDLQCNDGWLFP